MPNIECDQDDPAQLVIRAGDRETYLCQTIPGSRWDPARRVFTAPLSWGTWMALNGIFGQAGMQIGEQFGQWTRDEYDRRVKPSFDLRTLTSVLPDIGVPNDDRLFEFQRAGVAFLAVAERALLGDEMGTGKTVQAIMGLQRLHAYGHEVFPVLCVVPNSTKGQWKEHWDDWWPGLRVEVIDGHAPRRRESLESEADVYILHWQAMMLHSRLAPYGSVRLLKCGDHPGGDPDLKVTRCEVHEKELNRIKFRSVIVDECHRMKDVRAKQTRATWAVQHQDSVRYKFSLSGTPLADSPGDLWPIMHGLAPEEYPRRRSFEERYCLTSWSPFGGMDIVGINPAHRTEFFGLFDPRFRRMPKALVASHLPPISYERRDCQMAPKQARVYREIEQEMMTRTDDGDLILATNNLAVSIRLVQFASAYARVEDEKVILSEPSPKLDILEEIIDDAGKPLVACAESRQLIMLASERLEKRKIPHHCLVGGLTSDQRTAMLRDLNEGKVRVLLFTMQAGGEGLNMTAADTIVRLQRSWSMMLNVQTLARVHRLGSEIHDNITVVDVVTPGTIEERQFRVYREKMARLQEIARDRDLLRDSGRLAELAALEAEEQAIMSSSLLDK